MAQEVLPCELPEGRGGQRVTRPLYKGAVQEPAKRNAHGHAGLWFDKFCNQWDITGHSWKMSGEQKLKWIKTVTDSPAGKREQIDECVHRLKRLIQARGGRFEAFTTESRFVSGLGRNHPVDNGFAWHPTLGTPYLPGSSVKGLARAWAKLDADPSPPCETVKRLLGDREMAGGIGFLDAVPVAPAQLEADVMTPHYAGWKNDDPPGDWRSPVPIPFLTTAARTPFLFGVIPCGSATQEDLDTVLGWLRCALEWAGAGAKTAVGLRSVRGTGNRRGGRFRRRPQSGEGVGREHDREAQRRARGDAGSGPPRQSAGRGMGFD